MINDNSMLNDYRLDKTYFLYLDVKLKCKHNWLLTVKLRNEIGLFYSYNL